MPFQIIREDPSAVRYPGGGAAGGEAGLRSRYEEALALAAETGADRVTVPLIPADAWGLPRDRALRVALEEIGRFLDNHDLLVRLAVPDREAVRLSDEREGRLEELLGGRSRAPRARRGLRSERGGILCEKVSRPAEEAVHPVMMSSKAVPAPASGAETGRGTGKSLEEVLDGAGATFQQKLFQLIDESGLDDVTVYRRANVDRRAFSKIRSRVDYRPRKKTAVAFAVALKLDMPATEDLLSRAGYAFSPSSKFDLIVTYFLSGGNYDIYEINAALFEYGQPLLGA